MSDPVVLIGASRDDGSLLVVGLYATAKDAGYAVLHDHLPSAHYSVMTPALGSVVQKGIRVAGGAGAALRNMPGVKTFNTDPQT